MSEPKLIGNYSPGAIPELGPRHEHPPTFDNNGSQTEPQAAQDEVAGRASSVDTKIEPIIDDHRWLPIFLFFGALLFGTLGQRLISSPGGAFEGVVAWGAAIVSFVLVLKIVEFENKRTRYDRWAVLAERQLGANPLGALLLFISITCAVFATRTASQRNWDAPLTDSIVLWLLSMVCFVGAIVPWSRLNSGTADQHRGHLRRIVLEVQRHKWEITFLMGILAVGFVLRYFRVASIPLVFGGDEGEMGAEALAVLRGKLKNPFITGWLSHPTLFFFLQAAALKAFGENVYGLRMLSVIGGTLSIAVTFVLVRKLFDTWLALLTSTLLAVYNFHIHYSRLALNNIFDAVFAPLVLWLFYSGLVAKRVSYFVGAGLSLGLALYFYHGTRLIPVILVLFCCYLLIIDRDLIRDNLANLLWMAAATFIVSGPLLGFFALHPQDFMARLTQRGLFQSGWFSAQVAEGRAPFEIVLEQLRRSFLAFNLVPDPTGWFGTGKPLLDPLSGVLFVFGIAYALVRLRDKRFFLMLLWLLSGIFFGSTLLENPPASPSFVIVSVPAIFFVSLGLYKVGELTAHLIPRLRRALPVAALTFIVLFSLLGLSLYFGDFVPRRIYGGEVNWVATDLANYLLKRKGPFRVYMVSPPFLYLNIGTIRFIYPDLDGQDVLEPLTGPPDFVNKRKPALFVFIPARAEEFKYVKEAYPDGIRRDFVKEDGKTLFFIWEVRDP